MDGRRSAPQGGILDKDKDIRDIALISHKDVVGLNFIKPDGPYVFRRHFRQGLRSHILEILNPADLRRERTGTSINGIAHFPKARPVKMFRIFRARLSSLGHALEEIGRVKITECYLAPDFLARSNEMIVDYHGPQGKDLLLCGLQEYVPGVILDPWSLLDGVDFLTCLHDQSHPQAVPPAMTRKRWIDAARRNGALFIDRVKRMILEGGHIPDLAGVGNILIEPSGQIKLVDINNISEVRFDDRIRLDDRGYPVCDKSIEALSLLEAKLLSRPAALSEPLYQTFLAPQRLKAVALLEKRFSRAF